VGTLVIDDAVLTELGPSSNACILLSRSDIQPLFSSAHSQRSSHESVQGCCRILIRVTSRMPPLYGANQRRSGTYVVRFWEGTRFRTPDIPYKLVEWAWTPHFPCRKSPFQVLTNRRPEGRLRRVYSLEEPTNSYADQVDIAFKQ
jgi:hypothetical protein